MRAAYRAAGPQAVQGFRTVLEAKLKSGEGRAYIAAKLAEVTKAVENAAKVAQAV